MLTCYLGMELDKFQVGKHVDPDGSESSQRNLVAAIRIRAQVRSYKVLCLHGLDNSGYLFVLVLENICSLWQQSVDQTGIV